MLRHGPCWPKRSTRWRFWAGQNSPIRNSREALTEARKAIALAPNEPDGYRALGHILLARTDYDQAKDAVKRAIEINPSDASALAVWGSVQSFTGEVGGATESLQLALKLDPMLEPKFVFDLAVAYYLAHRHEDALRIAERGLARYSGFSDVQCPGCCGCCATGPQGTGRALCRGAPPPRAVSRSWTSWAHASKTLLIPSICGRG